MLALALAGSAPAQAPPEQPSGWTAKFLVRTSRDLISAANPYAVDAGIEILRRGGNAVDAAVAVQMVLNLVEPESSGIGGGAFLLHYDARSGETAAWDGRETAPAAVTERLFLDAERKPLPFARVVVGGRSVGVPGVLAMLEAVHRQSGRLPWRALFEPAIRLADEGYPITRKLHAQLVADPFLRTQRPAAEFFYLPDGQPKAIGSLLRNPELARLFRRIAAEGSAAFYTGEVARDIVDAVRNHPANPGVMTLADLEAYRPKQRQPICGVYRVRWKVCGMPMPSSGGTTVLQILGLLEGFELATLKPDSVDAVHLIAEAERLAYADRARYMADSDFVAVPVAGLLDLEYLRQRSGLIRRERSMGVPRAGEPTGAVVAGEHWSPDLPSTSHLSIVDADGNAVAMTTSIESGLGSRQMVRGFLLNNQLTDFSFVPVDEEGAPVANRVEAGKRPRSSMSPTLVFDPRGRLEMVLGSPGGSQIIQYVVKVLVATLDWGLDIQSAIDLGNFGAQTSAVTMLERGTAVSDVATPLQARGHSISVVELTSGLQGIRFDGVRDNGDLIGLLFARGGWAGGADPRREGVARGQ